MANFIAGAIMFGLITPLLSWPVAYAKGRRDMLNELKRRGEIK